MIQNLLEIFFILSSSIGWTMRKKVHQMLVCPIWLMFYYFISNYLDDDEETRAWRRQFFKWYLKVESFDTGDFGMFKIKEILLFVWINLLLASDNLFNQSAISWCDYDEILPDTSFLNGYQSLLDVYENFLKSKNIDIKLNTVVSKIQ